MSIAKSFLNHFIWKKVASPLEVICHRFLQVFQDHGIELQQIPRILPQIRLTDLQTPEQLAKVITPEVLDEIAELFGVRVQWLEGIDDLVYEYLGYDKQPVVILNHLKSLLVDEETKWLHPLRVLCSTKRLDRSNEALQHLVPVLLEKIHKLGEQSIYRYHVYQDGLKWDRYPCRIDLKVIARIVHQRLGIPVPLYEVPEGRLSEIMEGKLIPAKFFYGCLRSNPSLEDFALNKNENSMARETEELPEVLQYIENHGLHDFSFEVEEKQNGEIATLPEEHSLQLNVASLKPIGKRTRAQAEMWEPVKNAAQTLWAQDNKRSIADIVTCIKKMSYLKASRLSESAIRKHIADFAPEGIAGKPGRKPKQSSEMN